VAKEFVSELEKIIPAKELNFPTTAGFKPFDRYFTEDSVCHPAKANLFLLYYLIKKYTKKGDVVLDPMGGTGSTNIIASLLGRNSVYVDIEERFVEMARRNKKLLEERGKAEGWIKIICGDARKLNELLEEVGIVITSPPFASTKMTKKQDEFFERMVKTVLPGRDVEKIKRRYKSDYGSKENIGNLPLGSVDVIITSPPYNVDTSLSHISTKNRANPKSPNYRPSWKEYLETERSDLRISQEYGSVDVIITSPPYAQSVGHQGGIDKSDFRHGCRYRENYPRNRSNIGNMPYIDEEIEMLHEKLMKGGKPTYLSEMLKVYAQMFKVIKLGGRAIIIVKPFIRNKKVVDLPYHTYLLMRRCGFILEDLYKSRLRQRSFWRILQYQKHPEIPRINHEYVLVMRRPSGRSP